MTKYLLFALLFIPQWALSKANINTVSVEVVTELSPPNQLLQNDQVAGTSTELVKKILTHAQINARFTMYPWARAYLLAKKHPNTLIYSMARTTEREPLFHWIGPVALFKLGFVSLKGRTDIKIASLTQAIPYRLALQRGDISELVLKSHGFDYILTADIAQSYKLLMAKKVDIILDDARYLAPLASSFGLPGDSFRFVYEVPELTLNGYLAASVTTPMSIVRALRAAHKTMQNSKEYKRVMSQ
ncbi:substrate-binding periplasmic protein [Pseudoalteromonas aurantia]|uniref:Solute-binding protein family 3/N-terminal domain-containing protein n=2 Tax=Pseudoalteromonas TaxID=53246 RepID=A0ABR9EIM2_9GAMM|nr:transporter substrate-binding domain-containing protein [Pseudoalteromonas aurantia]MBE0370592.1 hypothetical protein [Pseudoalteromonas aurantia 208]